MDRPSVARLARHVVPPKLSPCAGCGARLPLRELVELHEDNHDNLTYFHGDLLCEECADGAGVVR